MHHHSFVTGPRLLKKEIMSLWDWSPYPEKTFSGTVAKGQVMPLSQES